MTQRTDEASVVVDYAYDTANRLTQRKKGESSTDVETYVYDGLGRLITAEKGTGSNGDAVSRSAFTYDSLSRVNEECQSIAEGSDDVAIFVGEVIAAVPNPQLSCIFDRNGDGTVNGLDIEPLVDDLLSGPSPRGRAPTPVCAERFPLGRG